MSSIFKKILLGVIIFCGCIVCTNFSSVVKAEDIEIPSEDQLSLLLGRVADTPEILGFESTDIGTFSIGESIPTYEYVNGSLVHTSFYMYPIFSNGNLLFFAIEIFGEGSGDVSWQLTPCYVDDISKYENSAEPIALIYDTSNCYIVSDDSANLIYTFCEPVSNRSEFTDETQVCAVVAASGISQGEVIASQTITSITAKAGVMLNKVPFIGQSPFKNLCWAASVAMVGQYKTGSKQLVSYIAQQVYPIGNFDLTLDLTGTRGILNKIYSIGYNNYSESAVPSDDLMTRNLANSNPLITRWSGSSKSHCMVIRGIESSPASVYIVDPEVGYATVQKKSGKYQYVGKNGGTFTLGGYVCKNN